MFNEHGEFTVTRQGDILRVRISGPWNAETAKAYKHCINKTIEPIKGRSWALISNVEKWELCTPECESLIVKLVAQCRENGLKREAVVNSNIKSIKLELFNKSSKEDSVEPSTTQFQRCFLETEVEAEAWLRNQGYGLN